MNIYFIRKKIKKPPSKSAILFQMVYLSIRANVIPLHFDTHTLR
jgi:hypothetical protein